MHTLCPIVFNPIASPFCTLHSQTARGMWDPQLAIQVHSPGLQRFFERSCRPHLISELSCRWKLFLHSTKPKRVTFWGRRDIRYRNEHEHSGRPPAAAAEMRILIQHIWSDCEIHLVIRHAMLPMQSWSLTKFSCTFHCSSSRTAHEIQTIQNCFHLMTVQTKIM